MRNWWVSTGTGAERLLPEDEVVSMLRGREVIAAVAFEGSTEWIDPRRYAPFAMAMSDAPRRQRPRIGAAWILASIAFAAAAVAAAFKIRSPRLQPASVSPLASAAAPEPSRSPLAERLFATDDLSVAFGIVREFMVDEPNQHSLGTQMLRIWASVRLKWSDVGISVDETSYGKVQKDVAAELGKRMCVTGILLEIHANHDGVAYYRGILSAWGSHLYAFFGVKSTGDLVADSQARFCGVVTGWYDYSNSAGGASHAPVLVGMFDLPENRAAPTRALAAPAQAPRATSRIADQRGPISTPVARDETNDRVLCALWCVTNRPADQDCQSAKCGGIK